MTTACVKHPSAEAVTTCARCSDALCQVCELYVGMQPHCSSCVRRHKRSRTVGIVSVVLLGLVAIGAASWYWRDALQETATATVDAVDYGEHADAITKLKAELKTAPCSRSKIVELARLYEQADAYVDEIDLIKTHQANCQPDPRLYRYSSTAHAELGEYKEAAADIDHLIKLSPENHNYYRWKANHLSSMGAHAEAADAYRTSLTLYPRSTRTPWPLSDALEASGHYCEAALPLQYALKQRPDVNNRRKVETQIGHLMFRGKCVDGYGTTSIGFGDGTTSEVTVSVRGRSEQTLHACGAPDQMYTSMSMPVAKKIGIAHQRGGKMMVRLDSGAFSHAKLATLKTLRRGTLAARNVPVAVMNDDVIPKGCDIMLGQSYLARFEHVADGDAIAVWRSRPAPATAIAK